MNGRERRPWRIAVWALRLVIAAAALWLGGLAWFAATLPREVGDRFTKSDGIVVLTGGTERMTVGLDLLAQGMAAKLFISGVDRGTNRGELQRLSQRAPELFECCVELGQEAEDTAGNAMETRDWARREGYRSLRVVTATYHMPRSLVELGRAVPEVELIANPVFPESVKLEGWWRWPGTASLMAVEFDKYLVSLARARLGG
jgi:uncharacterized SAM-binding protein YcdF (DUF218 family)